MEKRIKLAFETITASQELKESTRLFLFKERQNRKYYSIFTRIHYIWMKTRKYSERQIR